ncbi:MAG: amidohydrolase [Synergistaceae bacterium]|nr:amidohydrolase [Synergistaceae bacterium]
MYAEKFLSQVISWRRDIHSHPELSQHEERTSDIAANVLEGLGLEVKRNIGGFGVIGLLRGKGEGKTIALRADMDALPLNEETGLPYASQTQGVMHACGHDTHTAMLLGAACVLSEMRDRFSGNIKFIFQPAEEFNPTGGAPGMIREGVLENPYVDALIALHVWPLFETGKVAIRSGSCMAASDRIFLTVHGKTAHGSRPDQGNDAVVTSAHIITGLQSIISRSVSPLDSAVLTIGTIHGGYRYNVIPDTVKLEGTVRTLNPKIQSLMPELITRTAKGIAESLGSSCDVEYVKGYPPLVNDSSLASLAAESVRKIHGNDSVIIADEPDLAAEDFAFFARERPALMAWLGCRPSTVDAKDMAMLHNTKFNPDEGCFVYGIDYFVQTALDFLNAL